MFDEPKKEGLFTMSGRWVECRRFLQRGLRVAVVGPKQTTDAEMHILFSRNLAAASFVALVITAGSAFAQAGFEGLDLTDDAKKDDPKKAKEPEGLDLSADAPPKKATAPIKEKDEPKKPVVAKPDNGPAIERDVTQEDRVKSVQRKLYVKRGRFELAPAVVINVNDPYYTKVGGSLRAAFHVADALAIAARFTLMQTAPTDDVRVAKKNLQSKIFYSVPYWSVMADVEWSPFYGKVSFLNSILHLDAYVLGGGGVVSTETSGARNEDGSADLSRTGVKPAFDLGLGMRFVAKDFLAVNVALVNTTYTDVPTGSTKAVTQNLMMLQAGVSIFFPFKSTFREAE
jgi:outer membrane beta-barrel protein